MTFHEYILCYDRLDTLSDEDRSLYITILISLEELEGKYSVAIDIMKICVTLFADNIPASLLRSLFTSDEELSKTILLLEENNLIKRKVDGVGNFNLFIHRLVQDVLRKKVSQSDQMQCVLTKAAELVLSRTAPRACDDSKEFLSKNSAMLPFATSILSHYEEFEKNGFKNALDIEMGRHYCYHNINGVLI